MRKKLLWQRETKEETYKTAKRGRRERMRKKFMKQRETGERNKRKGVSQRGRREKMRKKLL
jgi:hypothetical protein